MPHLKAASIRNINRKMTNKKWKELKVFYFLFIYKIYNIQFKITIFIFFLHQFLVQYLCKRFFLCHAFKSRWYNQAHLSFSFPGNCGNNRIKLVSFKEAVNQLWYFRWYVAIKKYNYEIWSVFYSFSSTFLICNETLTKI